MKNKNASKRGFTLVEILIAVLIIGVLMSIAVPMYQGSIDKSRWAKLLSPSRAIANAQEAMLMSQGKYTTAKEDLDVSLPNDGEYDYQLYTVENGDEANLVRVESDKLDNVRLARYYEKNEGFSNQLYCEAKTGNDRANKLCGKLLQGEELLSTEDGYKAYLLNEDVGEVLCNRVDRWWSTSKDKCYSTLSEKCTALGSAPIAGTDYCGWQGTVGQIITEELTCLAKGGSYSNPSCASSIIKSGGVCRGQYNDFSNGCKDATIADGGVCLANSKGACTNATIKDGGMCISRSTGNGSGCDGGTVEDGGVCVVDGGRGCYSHVEDGGMIVIASGGGNLQGWELEAGGVCLTRVNYSGCYAGNNKTINGTVILDGCQNCGVDHGATIDGGICASINGNAGCGGRVTYTNNAVCYAGSSSSLCSHNYVQYTSGGCCCGYCGNKPTCDASRCSAVAAQIDAALTKADEAVAKARSVQ